MFIDPFSRHKDYDVALHALLKECAAFLLLCAIHIAPLAGRCSISA